MLKIKGLILCTDKTQDQSQRYSLKETRVFHHKKSKATVKKHEFSK